MSFACVLFLSGVGQLENGRHWVTGRGLNHYFIGDKTSELGWVDGEALQLFAKLCTVLNQPKMFFFLHRHHPLPLSELLSLMKCFNQHQFCPY